MMNTKTKIIALAAAIAATVLGFSTFVHATERSATIINAIPDKDLEFKQPQPKVANAMYDEMMAAYKTKDKNAVLFVDQEMKQYSAVQKSEGRDEPEGEWMGCVLYQLGGLKTLQSVDVVETQNVLNTNKENAEKWIDSMTEENVKNVFKIWYLTGKYNAECYRYVHGGFIAGIPHNTEI